MKKNLIFLAVILIGTNVYAADVASLATWNLGYYDTTFGSIILKFLTYRKYFYDIARTFSVAVAIIGAFWWVMKIILMGESNEKAITDILTKAILFIVIMTTYPKLVDGVMELGTTLGFGNQKAEIEIVFTKMASDMEAQVNGAINALANNIFDGYKFDGITEKEIKYIAKQLNLNSPEMQQNFQKTIESMDLTVYKGSGFLGKTVKTSKRDYANELNQQYKLLSSYAEVSLDYDTGIWTVTDPQNKELAKALENTVNESFAAWMKVGSALAGNAEDGITLKDAAIRIQALIDCCTSGVDKDALTQSVNESYSKLQPIKISDLIKLNPYLSSDVMSSNGESVIPLPTSLGRILSPSAIMKTSILVASICNSATKASVTLGQQKSKEKNNDNSDQSWLSKTINIVKAKIVDLSFEYIWVSLIDLMINVAVIACGAYFCIQYIMMILEFYIVTAMGYLLLPLIMWEVSSSYAKNLIKLLVSYFFKIMVMCIVLCFAWVQFFNLANMLTQPGFSIYENPWGVLGNVLFTLLLCLTFVGEAPKIAQTLLTGNPEMSMGEFMKQVGAVGFAARAGMKAAKGTLKAGNKLAKGTGKAAMKTAGHIAGFKAAHGAKKKEKSAADGLVKQAGSEHTAALKNQETAKGMAKQTKAKADSAKDALTVSKGKENTAKQNLEKANAKLDSARDNMNNAKGKKAKKAARKAFIAADENAHNKQKDYWNAVQNRKIDQGKYNDAKKEHSVAMSNLQTANAKVSKTGTFLKDAKAHRQQVKSIGGGRDYVGNALKNSVSNSVSKYLGLDSGSAEYKNGQWQNKTASSKSGIAGYMQYQRDKALAGFDKNLENT